MASTSVMLAPHQRRRELQSIRRAQFVNIQESFGRISDLIDRLDLPPSTAQIVETEDCLLPALLCEVVFANEPIQRAVCFNYSRPPRYLSRIDPRSFAR